MRSPAKIHKITLLVEGYHAAFRKIVYEFRFIRFGKIFENFKRFGLIVNKSFYRKIALYYLLHFLFDLGKVFFRYRRFEFYVVVKPVFYRRTYRKLTGGKNVFNRLRKNVRTGVAINVQPFLVFKGDDLKSAIPVQNVRKIHESPVHLAAHGVAVQPFRYRFRDATDRRIVFDFHNGTVF